MRVLEGIMGGPMVCKSLLITYLMAVLRVSASTEDLFHNMYQRHHLEICDNETMHAFGNPNALPWVVFGDEEFLETIEENSHFNIFTFAFEEVKTSMVWGLAILAAIFARGLILRIPIIKSRLQASAIEIFLGMIVASMFGTNQVSEENIFEYDSHAFFIFILPPIILAEGFHTNTRLFFKNLESILLHAIIGTLFNMVFIGYIMFEVAQSAGIEGFRTVDGFLFGSFIAAVDPVAVLAVFETQHVDLQLKALVAGESVINDGLSVVLYRIMVAAAYSRSHSEGEGDWGLIILYGILYFFFVFGLGVLIGIIFGVLGCASLKILTGMEALEPLVLLGWGFLSYNFAEMIHVTGIITIYAYGMILHQYTPRLLSTTNHASLENLLTTLAHVADTAVFIILGINTYKFVAKGWNTKFVIAGIFLINLSRFISIFGLGFIDNFFVRGRSALGPILPKDLTVMAFGGLRGAIAFSLAFVLADPDFLCFNDTTGQVFQHRDLFISTTICLVLFTVIVQGSLVPDLLNALHTARAEEKEKNFFQKLTRTMADHIHDGIMHIKSNKSWSLWWEDIFHHTGQIIGKWATRREQDRFSVYAEELDKNYVAKGNEAFQHLNSIYWAARDEAIALGLVEGCPDFEFFIADRLHQQMFEEITHFSTIDHHKNEKNIEKEPDVSLGGSLRTRSGSLRKSEYNIPIPADGDNASRPPGWQRRRRVSQRFSVKDGSLVIPPTVSGPTGDHGLPGTSVNRQSAGTLSIISEASEPESAPPIDDSNGNAVKFNFAMVTEIDPAPQIESPEEKLLFSIPPSTKPSSPQLSPQTSPRTRRSPLARLRPAFRFDFERPSNNMSTDEILQNTSNLFHRVGSTCFINRKGAALKLKKDPHHKTLKAIKGRFEHDRLKRQMYVADTGLVAPGANRQRSLSESQADSLQFKDEEIDSDADNGQNWRTGSLEDLSESSKPAMVMPNNEDDVDDSEDGKYWRADELEDLSDIDSSDEDEPYITIEAGGSGPVDSIV